jgi:hypothetical protein
MDDIDSKLYQEENRQALIDIQKTFENFGTELKRFNDNYIAPKENVTVDGKIEVNTEKEVAINNLAELTDKFKEFTTTISTAIAEHSYKPLETVEISNIDDITPKSIEINNFKDMAEFFEGYTKAIKENRPIVNITKQDVVFPTSPKNPLPVRLSNGKQFIDALSVAMAGGSQDQRMTFTETGELRTTANIDMATEGLATEATLAKVNTNLEEYGINNIDPVSAVLTYTGKEDKDGNWLVVKIDTTTGTVITYATVANNPATATYASAWTNHLTLTYGIFSAAF